MRASSAVSVAAAAAAALLLAVPTSIVFSSAHNYNNQPFRPQPHDRPTHDGCRSVCVRCAALRVAWQPAVTPTAA